MSKIRYVLVALSLGIGDWIAEIGFIIEWRNDLILPVLAIGVQHLLVVMPSPLVDKYSLPKIGTSMTLGMLTLPLSQIGSDVVLNP